MTGAGVADGHVVRTRSFELAQRALSDLGGRRGMVLLSGESGTGTTFATRVIVGELDLPVAWMHVPPATPSYKRLLQVVLETLTGLPAQGTAAQLDLQLKDAVARSPLVLIVDKAERTRKPLVQLLCDLHDHAGSQLSIGLVGDASASNLLVRFEALRTRVQRTVRFERLSAQEALDLIPGLHPIYETADPDLLYAIDKHFAQGLLSAWATFTADAVDLMSRHGLYELTEEVLDNILTLHGMADD